MVRRLRNHIVKGPGRHMVRRTGLQRVRRLGHRIVRRPDNSMSGGRATGQKAWIQKVRRDQDNTRSGSKKFRRLGN